MPRQTITSAYVILQNTEKLNAHYLQNIHIKGHPLAIKANINLIKKIIKDEITTLQKDNEKLNCEESCSYLTIACSLKQIIVPDQTQQNYLHIITAEEYIQLKILFLTLAIYFTEHTHRLQMRESFTFANNLLLSCVPNLDPKVDTFKTLQDKLNNWMGYQTLIHVSSNKQPSDLCFLILAFDTFVINAEKVMQNSKAAQQQIDKRLEILDEIDTIGTALYNFGQSCPSKDTMQLKALEDLLSRLQSEIMLLRPESRAAFTL